MRDITSAIGMSITITTAIITKGSYGSYVKVRLCVL